MKDILEEVLPVLEDRVESLENFEQYSEANKVRDLTERIKAILAATEDDV